MSDKKKVEKLLPICDSAYQQAEAARRWTNIDISKFFGWGFITQCRFCAKPHLIPPELIATYILPENLEAFLHPPVD